MLSSLRSRLAEVGRPFIQLMISDVLMQTATMVGYVALPWWIAHAAGAHDLARYGVVMGIVAVIATPLLSPFGDRYEKRLLIVLGLGVLVLEGIAVAILSSLGIYHIGGLIGLGSLAVMANALIGPTTTSIALELVPASKLSTAMSLQKSAQSLGRLIGPALSGLTLAAFSITAALWLHVALLAAATLLAFYLPRLPVAGSGGGGLARWWRELRAGVAANWAIPIERVWTIANFANWLFTGPAVGMLVPLKIKSLGLSGWWLGCCEAAISLGMLIGAFGLSNWLIERYGRYRTRIGAAVVQGLALAIAGYIDTPLLIVVAFWLVGAANSALVLVGMTHRMLARPEAFRARMTAASITAGQVAGSLGPALAGIALLHWQLEMVYLSFGVMSAITASALILVPGFKHFMSLDHEGVKNWYGRQYPAVFQEPKPTSPSRAQEA